MEIDEQILVMLGHLLVYADQFDIEGLVSSPYGPGRKEHILKVIDLYDRDYAYVRTYSDKYSSPDTLRALTKQGAIESAGYEGFGTPTEGSEWIVRCARRDDPRPLWVLVWGGRFVRAWERPHVVFTRLTGPDDRIEQFGVFELALPLGDPRPQQPQARLLIENQESIGAVDANGVMRWRFSPKDAKTYRYTIRSNVPALEGQSGELTSLRPSPDSAQHPSPRRPSWWTDDPTPEVAEGPHIGARTVSRWREEILRDFASHMDRCQSAVTRRIRQMD